ncbi:hypothetical protein [Actinomadura sediminis]|uniref:HEAT repeat domain-containing protein n=1 Tax=Actinomadura sediminis TaxID=1038904 RepID=A0ABW3EHD5_9ACTN
MTAGRVPAAVPRPGGAAVASGDPLLDELRGLAADSPSRARVAGWEYLRELSRKDDRAAISALFARGLPRERSTGGWKGSSWAGCSECRRPRSRTRS